MSTDNLQQAVAELYPEEYQENTWQQLLPRFMAYHEQHYQQRVEDYKAELASWQQGDQTTPEPSYPMYPLVYTQAATERARHAGFTYEALAVLLYSAQERADYYQKRSQQFEDLCRDFDRESMKLAADYKSLYLATTVQHPN